MCTRCTHTPHKEVAIVHKQRFRLSPLRPYRKPPVFSSPGRTTAAKPSSPSKPLRRVKPAAGPARRAYTPPPIERLVVHKSGSGWALRVDDLDEPAWQVRTKRKATRAARLTAEELGCTLVIERADGSVQSTTRFAEGSA